MANQPAAATIRKVQDQLGATPRSTADLANRSGLSPSTTRKALTALATEGLAAKTEAGDWHAVTTAQPEAPAKAAKATKAAKKATKATKATKAAAPSADEVPNPLTGLAAKLAALGLSDKLARHDAQLVELLGEHGPLTKAEVLAKLPGLSDWAFRRMSQGRHADQSFEPLVAVTGTGKDRKYEVAGK